MTSNHTDNCEESVLLEKMSTVDLAMWLQSKGFGAAVQSAFEGELIFASGSVFAVSLPTSPCKASALAPSPSLTSICIAPPHTFAEPLRLWHACVEAVKYKSVRLCRTGNGW